jgi:hypothetical protein
LGVLRFINVYFECIRTTILDVYSNIIININGLDIMVTLNGIYIEYIKIICKMFVKYIVAILQMNFIFISINYIYIYIYIYSCSRKLKLRIIFN